MAWNDQRATARTALGWGVKGPRAGFLFLRSEDLLKSSESRLSPAFRIPKVLRCVSVFPREIKISRSSLPDNLIIRRVLAWRSIAEQVIRIRQSRNILRG